MSKAKSFGNIGSVASSFISIDAAPMKARPVKAQAEKASAQEKRAAASFGISTEDYRKVNAAVKKAVQAELPNMPTAPAVEYKTRRLNSLLKPSLHEYLTRSAARLGVSANDRLNALIEAARNSDPLEK